MAQTHNHNENRCRRYRYFKEEVALSAECRVDDRVSEIFDADDASGLLMLASITTLPARTRIVMR